MEWRSEYQIKVGQSESQDLFVKVEAPSWSWSNWGIYNHFETHVTGRTIRIVPKFLFGLPIDTIGEYTMAIGVVEFSSGGYRIRKIVA